MIDWDDAYNNVGHIKDAASYPARWAELARLYRKAADSSECDIAYGQHEREKLDIFYPPAPPRGLIIFVHGGYWLRLDKSFWSHLAEGARQRGWAVAIPSYILTPEARISQITQQIGAAISRACQLVDGPVRLAGHSAGGQLVSRMVCLDSPLAAPVRERIARVMSISGVHDLRPLLHTTMNQTLGLSESEAELESPCLQRPLNGPALSAWVGSLERPEFIRQMKLFTEAWEQAGADIKGIIDPGQHHFSVIDGLSDVSSRIVGELLR